jgi:hypothetical protein
LAVEGSFIASSLTQLRVKKFYDTRIETLPSEEVDSREHIIILGDMLEDLLLEQDKLSPKETIKEFENHLKAINKEFPSLYIWIPHETTGELITVPGWVLQQEQQLITKLTWQIESCQQ